MIKITNETWLPINTVWGRSLDIFGEIFEIKLGIRLEMTTNFNLNVYLNSKFWNYTTPKNTLLKEEKGQPQKSCVCSVL